jgi:hypothetical protein
VVHIEEAVPVVRLPHLDRLRTALAAWVIGGHALLGYSTVGGWPCAEVNEVSFAPPMSWCSSRCWAPPGCS